MIRHDIQDKLLHFDAFEGDVDDVLSAFLLLQFQLTEPHYEFVRLHLLTYVGELRGHAAAPLTALFRKMEERGMIRTDIDLADLVLAFQSLNAGLTALWALEGPPFAKTGKVLRLQMKIFSEGLKAGQAYEV